MNVALVAGVSVVGAVIIGVIGFGIYLLFSRASASNVGRLYTLELKPEGTTGAGNLAPTVAVLVDPVSPSLGVPPPTRHSPRSRRFREDDPNNQDVVSALHSAISTLVKAPSPLRREGARRSLQKKRRNRGGNQNSNSESNNELFELSRAPLSRKAKRSRHQ